jgi:hypothetical protein
VVSNSVLDKIYAQGSNVFMSSKPERGKVPGAQIDEAKPVWAAGLKRMYDSVVGEDVPDEIADLLKRLDQAGDEK